MKLLKNRRKLNNKGFTLIELLAVVVILAIVMGISATSVLNSINNSRKSSLYSAAQNAANTLNTWISEDMIVTDALDKKLGDAFVTQTQTASAGWICLGDLVIQDSDNSAKDATTGEPTPKQSLAKALSLNDDDVNLNTSVNPMVLKEGSTTEYELKVTVTTGGINDTCSALRYNSSTGGYEILLVAKNGGKYFVSSDGYTSNNYAFSRAKTAGVLLDD